MVFFSGGECWTALSVECRNPRQKSILIKCWAHYIWYYIIIWKFLFFLGGLAVVCSNSRQQQPLCYMHLSIVNLGCEHWTIWTIGSFIEMLYCTKVHYLLCGYAYIFQCTVLYVYIHRFKIHCTQLTRSTIFCILYENIILLFVKKFIAIHNNDKQK